MFNLPRNFGVPGFRVDLPVEDEFGFNLKVDGAAPALLPGTPDVTTVDDNYPFGTTSPGFIAPQRPGANPTAPLGNPLPVSPAGNQNPTPPMAPAGPLPFEPQGPAGAFAYARYVPNSPINQAEPAAEPPDPMQKTSGGTDFSPIGSAQAQTPQAQRPGSSLKIDPSPGEAVVLPDGSTIDDKASSTGKLMSPKPDLNAVAAAGRQVGSMYQTMLSSPEGAAAAFPYLLTQLGLNVSHWGKYDYQRQGNIITGGTHLPQFAHVSNFNVGLFAQQAGLSLDETLEIAGRFACRFSNNSDQTQPHCLNKEQLEYTTVGYKAGQSGMFGRLEDTR